MNIVVVSAEVAPWSKVGGLGDVAGALPVALAARGHRVMTVAPRYKQTEDAWWTGCASRFHLFGTDHEVAYFHARDRGVDRVFVDHMSFLRPGVYGDSHGAYADNQFRFALLSRAAIEAPLNALGGDPYGEDVVFLANDWHAALVPAYINAMCKPFGRFGRARSVLAIHNLAHQGTFARETWEGLDLPTGWYPNADMHGRLNTLKAGIVAADRIVTVSEGYAWEILSEEGGWGLDPILRMRSGVVSGIRNGIDPVEWDPQNDPHIGARYGVDDLGGKARCKSMLQDEFGLPERVDTPLVGFVGRLDAQKGVDLIETAMPWFADRDVQLVALGSGGPHLESVVRDLGRHLPGRASGHVGYSAALSHRIVAGADLLLMPSRFEPCGLTQMYAMRYGTVPVVHRTGGLRDTVLPVEDGGQAGTGWTFEPCTPAAMAGALDAAVGTWRRDREAFRRVQRRGMSIDWSWARAAAAYEALFASIR